MNNIGSTARLLTSRKYCMPGIRVDRMDTAFSQPARRTLYSEFIEGSSDTGIGDHNISIRRRSGTG